MTDNLAAAPVRLVPFADRMIVRTIGHKNRTSSGLYIPEQGLDGTPYIRAEVIYVGPGRRAQDGSLIPVQFRPGAIVVFFRGGEIRQAQLVLPSDATEQANGVELMLISEPHVAFEIEGLDRVSGLVGDDGKPLVMS